MISSARMAQNVGQCRRSLKALSWSVKILSLPRKANKHVRVGLHRPNCCPVRAAHAKKSARKKVVSTNTVHAGKAMTGTDCLHYVVVGDR